MRTMVIESGGREMQVLSHASFRTFVRAPDDCHTTHGIGMIQTVINKQFVLLIGDAVETAYLGSHLIKMWHRSMEFAQRKNGIRNGRSGAIGPSTFIP